MLSLEDVIKIYNAKFDIEIEDDHEDVEDQDLLILGHCDFKDKQVILYISLIGDSVQELYKTIIHEFIHARDYLLGTITDAFIESKDEESRMRFIDYERRVEDETLLTYKNQPDIAKTIFECWGFSQYINKAA